VLVIDDNAENRALAQALLEDEGYRVRVAPSGQAGLEAFAHEGADCILLDIRMPGLDGITVCERLRALPAGDQVAIIFVTAHRDVETFDRAVAAGGDDFLTKPFRASEVLIRIETALRLRTIAAERGNLSQQIKHQRDELQRLQLQKEQLVAFLVHDFKNPVNAIELQAQLLLRDPDASERARRAALRIQDESRTLLRLILNLLDISRADEGGLAPAPSAIDARALIEAVMDELRPRATAAGLRLTARVATPTLRADPDLVRRALANLVENAIRHAPEGSEIAISATTVEGVVELRVQDAGRGIPVERRTEVFERFRSGIDSTTSSSNRGLGLAFAKLVAEAHGGRIWIEDAAPGAIFCVRLGA